MSVVPLKIGNNNCKPGETYRKTPSICKIPTLYRANFAEDRHQHSRGGLSRSQIERYELLCKDLESEPAVVAQAWLLQNPAVTAPIIGPRTMGQLESAVKATELKLDQESMAKLDEIWPGPGGEAPEAYAW
ncbi:MAG: hypothetical protein CL911_05220 [Deltaproteobacteria bacterium]|nr:hypothetical protein [Deltaproteobacteria bacterium]